MTLSLATFFPFRLARLAEAVSLEMRQVYHARHGLTRPDWRVLAWLGEQGEATASEIAALSAMHKTKVSRAVRRLEQRRWLRRARDTNDRRVERLTLTKTGRAAFEDVAEALLEREAQVLAKLSPAQQKALLRAIGALEAALLENGGGRAVSKS